MYIQKQRPIAFSPPMVLANQEGLKSQTRRLNGEMLSRINDNLSYTWKVESTTIQSRQPKTFDLIERQGFRFTCAGINDIVISCPYGQVGDILWVRERHKIINAKSPHHDFLNVVFDGLQGEVIYSYIRDGIRPETMARIKARKSKPTQWVQARYLPHDLARMFLQITNIRVERLQDITETDALAEGVERWKSPLHTGKFEYLDYSDAKGSRFSNVGFVQATTSYMSLWESINGKGSWAVNPYVWVIEYKRIDKPVSQEKEVSHA